MCTVELLEQDDPRQLVGQRHRAQRKLRIHAPQRRRSERSADHEGEVNAGLAALVDEGAEGEAVVCPPLGGQQHRERTVRDPPHDGIRVAHLHELQAGVAGE